MEGLPVGALVAVALATLPALAVALRTLLSTRRRRDARWALVASAAPFVVGIVGMMAGNLAATQRHAGRRGHASETADVARTVAAPFLLGVAGSIVAFSAAGLAWVRATRD